MLTYTVQDAIDTTAGLRPGSCAFLNMGIDVSYGQLASDVLHASRFVMSQGLTPGKRAAIMMPPSYLHVVLILALDRLGVASVSQNMNKDMMSQPWIQALDLDCVFASDTKPESTDIAWIELEAGAQPRTLPIPPELAEADVPTDREPTRITRLVFSSGTTGNPKAVPLSREIAMKRIIAHHLFCEGAGSNRYLLGMPFSTIAGYGWLLMVLCRGATAIPCPNPRGIVRFIDAYQISHLLLTPILFQNVIEIGHRSGRDFTSVCVTTTGGAPFDVRLAYRARAVLGSTIWNGYTSTEAGSIARGHISQLEGDPNMIGIVLPFVTLEIVDDDDKPLPRGETGIVRIASELAVSAYDNGEDEGRVFRDGFVYSGDLGSLDEQGRLRILGRVDELINLRGIKTPPEEIERPMTTLQGVREVAVFQADLGQGLQVCAAVVLTNEQTAEELSKKVQELLGHRAPQRIRIVPELPRNAMGKIMRRDLADQFVADMKSQE